MISAGGRVPYVDYPGCLHPINPPQSHRAAASSANTSDGFSSWITAGLGLCEGLVVWCKTKCACNVLISQFWRAATESQLPMPLSRITPSSLFGLNTLHAKTFLFLYGSHAPQALWAWAGCLGLVPTRPTPHHCPQATRLPSMLTCCGILPAAHLDALSPPLFGHANVPHPSIPRCEDLLSPATYVLNFFCFASTLRDR